MSNLNAGIILGGRQPDIMGSFAQGQKARLLSDEMQNQNALRNVYQTQGAGILSGDQNALNALAQFDPSQAVAIQGQHQRNAQSVEAHNQQMAQREQLMKQEVEKYAKTLSKEQAAAQAAQLEQGITRAIGAYQAGDLNAVNQILQSAGEQPLQSLEQFPAIAALYGDALSTLKSVVELTAPEKPSDEYGRYAAEEKAAGREPLGRIEYAQAKKGKGTVVYDPQTGKPLVSIGGGDVNPTDISNPSSPAAMIASIDGILNDPALGTSTGLLAPLQNIPGTPQRRVGARIDQLDGQAFLQAFESLKGGGQITEIEGQKATQAIGRLDDYQNPEDYKQALVELRDILATAMGRPPGWADQQSSTPGEIPTVSDEAGYDALPSGTVFIAPDGTQRRKP
jgi:CII-binding regulator of phage lambda lysogenization HflD